LQYNLLKNLQNCLKTWRFWLIVYVVYLFNLAPAKADAGFFATRSKELICVLKNYYMAMLMNYPKQIKQKFTAKRPRAETRRRQAAGAAILRAETQSKKRLGDCHQIFFDLR
jgi:hypothetical protein